MAEALDMGKDPNGPAHSSTLFVRADGSPLSFYVRLSPIKRRLSTLILHGGTVCRVQGPGAVLLAQPGKARVTSSPHSTSWTAWSATRGWSWKPIGLGAASAGEQAPESKPWASAAHRAGRLRGRG
ncbi:Telomeric repeat-binding factor 2-interacting protein 1 [Fukomys damarensis]|uniref:Telomeric repeat-binding factor 2-interacting protein 1 n=1 Tax=Fukomys damarensis TaxID=885580 RepID=A0A091CND1_FUKDA|nr:Telomeric repeat-binding factor 2-interacting protein 1 [Fukomys damarensis]